MNNTDMNWIRNSRIFAYESWWPPFWPHMEVDWDNALWTMKRLELDTLQANCLTKWACYPTKLVRMHPELNGRDMVMEAQEFCRKHGFKIIIYSLFGHSMPVPSEMSKPILGIFRPMIPDKDIKSNPRHLSTVPEEYHDYYTRFHFGDERYIAHCPFASEEWLAEISQEMADRYEYDGAWIDGSLDTGWVNGQPLNICTCSTCQKMYEDDFGHPMPIITDFSDPRLYELKRWVMRKFDRILERITGIFTKNRTVPIIGNIANPSNAQFYPENTRHLNGGLFEHAPDQSSLVLKIGESRHLVETAIHYIDCYDPWPRKVTSGWEAENKGLTILAHGGTPYLAMPGKYCYDDSIDEPAFKIFSFMKERKKILSEQSRDAFAAVVSLPMGIPGREGPKREALELHNHCVRGWTKALLDSHVPISGYPFYLLNKSEKLQEYPVVVLPDIETMSSDMLESVYNYVDRGGGLLIEYGIASFNENFARDNDNRLDQLFDLNDYKPTKEELLRRYRFEGADYGLISGATYDVYMRSDGDAMDRCGFPVPSDRIFPSHVGWLVPGKSWDVLSDLVPTDEDRPLMPALACKTIGKGKVLFSTVSWGVQYIQRVEPELAKWMNSLIRWLSNEQLAFHVEGSSSVQLGTTKTNDGYLVYLINNSNDYQPKRMEWREMMRVADKPYALGKFSLTVDGYKNAEALYGPDPDQAKLESNSLKVVFDNFMEHSVLRIF